MQDRLQRFIDDARGRVAAGFYDVPDRLESNGSLVGVMGPAAIISELKPRSPSEGRILQRPAEELLDAYRGGGAAAISVLTDGDHFDGHPDLLRLAHATGLPTLMKDFIVDERQLDCARALGASSVLLIERCFPDAAKRERLVAAAHRRGLEVLLEVFSDDDWMRARESAADLIGVNARDLETLRVDAPAAHTRIERIVATGRPVIALSGITTRHDRLQAVAAGATGVLVGTQLVRSPAPSLWLKALRRPLAKVCGIRDQEALQAACASGADLVGFVVGAPGTPRDLAPLRAQQLALEARAAGAATVLVTPHTDAWEVREWCRVVRPDFVQLHGLRPDVDWIHSLGAIPTHVLHAVGPDDELPGSGVGFVLDAARAGSGATHDWAAASHRAAPGLTLIAGGLARDNVAAALADSKSWGADASSRLESSPGRKDPQAIAAFVAAVHGAP